MLILSTLSKSSLVGISFPELKAAVKVYNVQFDKKRYNHNHDSKGRFCSGNGAGGGSGKSLDKSGKSVIMESAVKKPITQITDETINKVPYVKIDGYTAEQCAESQRQHMELLKCSRDYNDCKKVAFFLDSNMNRNKLVKDTDDKLKFGEMYGTNLACWKGMPKHWYMSKDLVITTKDDFISDITKSMSEWGEGSRAQVHIDWGKSKGSHYITAKYIDGKIEFYDYQNGKAVNIAKSITKWDEESYLSPWFMRIDDKEFSENVLSAVKSRG